ncbi:TetR/AcrR family transcriptional regulator [Rhodocaloribacter litoris]|uniref:TetR/AcrR family transcriptional regulator n=1 Tax=Rhodocaloribacter litoris TaxID=2558931 RepID=UPI0014210831|nr:TetR/AcrR family transcriptional regulator [Rhodocaloribacter litoris]QXD14582.1 TetR/AcrR family transcriptional regulator [Rhodocaloribacter litoris]GIV59648.1 MAG: TetR family transcriptional regulator [Rhodothermaceae bacterium]
MEPSAQDSGDLRRRILDTARCLLVADGYKRLSMRKIARAIGYSATSIYLHFESKDALVHALIEEGMERLYGAFRRVWAAHPDDPYARLEALCRCYVDFGLEHPEYYEIMYLLHPEQMARFPAEKYRRARRNLELLVETLAEGAERGVFVPEDPLRAASAIWASLHGVVSLLLSRRVDVRVEPRQLVDATIRQVLRGYAVTPLDVDLPASG